MLGVFHNFYLSDWAFHLLIGNIELRVGGSENVLNEALNVVVSRNIELWASFFCVCE